MSLQQTVQKVICEYDVRMILNSEGIVIFLYCHHRRRYYQTRIPYIYEGKSKEIQDIFINLDEFFIYFQQFSEDRNRISIDQKGTIRIAYIIQRSKNIVPPVVYITTELLKTGAQMKNETKLHREITDVRKQNLMLQNRITQLTKLSQNNEKEIQELKRIFQKDVKRYDNSSESESDSSSNHRKHNKKKKKKRKYSVVSGGKESLVEMATSIKEFNKDFEMLKQRIGDTEGQQNGYNSRKGLTINPAMVPLNEYMTEQKIFGRKIHITVDENNKFLKQHFLVEGNRIQKIKKYQRLQLLSREVIPPMDKHHFVMIFERVTFQIFSFGIVSQRRRNYQNSHQSKWLISYFAKTGAFWQYSQSGEMPCRTGGPKIPLGAQVKVVVDMNKFMVIIYINNQEIASTTIQQHMRKERLVAYMEINYEGDVVYWNERTPELM